MTIRQALNSGPPFCHYASEQTPLLDRGHEQQQPRPVLPILGPTVLPNDSGTTTPPLSTNTQNAIISPNIVRMDHQGIASAELIIPKDSMGHKVPVEDTQPPRSFVFPSAGTNVHSRTIRAIGNPTRLARLIVPPCFRRVSRDLEEAREDAAAVADGFAFLGHAAVENAAVMAEFQHQLQRYSTKLDQCATTCDGRLTGLGESSKKPENCETDVEEHQSGFRDEIQTLHAEFDLCKAEVEAYIDRHEEFKRKVDAIAKKHEERIALYEKSREEDEQKLREYAKRSEENRAEHERVMKYEANMKWFRENKHWLEKVKGKVHP